MNIITNTISNSSQQPAKTLGFTSSSDRLLSLNTEFFLVSVVIPVYNGARYIQVAIDSILEQTYNNYEIIVIDDGSTDDTRQQLQLYKGKIRYIYQENQGSAAARNLGINLSKGNLVAFLDADDFWTMPDKLEKQVYMFVDNPSLGGINTGWTIVDDAGNQIKTVQPWHKSPILNLETWLKKKCVRTSAMIFRKGWLEKVGGFDEELKQSHDVDLALRLSLAGCETVWLKEATVAYRQHDNNTTKNNLKQAKYMQAVLDKFFARQDLPESISAQESQIRYHTLVWIAWYQYCSDDLDEMQNFLQKSFNLSPYLRVENISHWLNSFERFSEDRGCEIDIDRLTSSKQWRNLITVILELFEFTDGICEFDDLTNNKNQSNKPHQNIEQNLLGLFQSTHEQKVVDTSSVVSSEFAKKYQIAGDALFRQGHIKEALKCYQAAVRINPELIEAHQRLVVFLLEQGDLDGTIASCESILQANPQDYETLEKFADALLRRGNHDDLSRAVEYYEQIIRNNPNDLKNYFKILQLKSQNLEIYLYLGKALLDKGEFVHAVVLSQIARQIFPQHQQVSWLLDRAISQQQRTTCNFHDLLKVKSDSVDNLDFISAMSFFQIGELLKKEKKIDEAAICLKKAVALQPDNYKFHHELGGIYREQRQFESAIEEGKLTIKLKPDFVWAYHNMGRAFERIGLIDKAIKSYQQALKINPGLTVSRDALNRLADNIRRKEIEKYKMAAREQMKAKKFSEAKESYLKGIAIQPNDHDLYHNLGNVLRELGDLEGAIEQAKKAIELKPDFYWGHHNLGRALEKKGIIKQAIRAYCQALKINPNSDITKEKLNYLKDK